MIGSVYALAVMGATLIYGIPAHTGYSQCRCIRCRSLFLLVHILQDGNLSTAFLISMAITGLIGVLLHTIYADFKQARILPIAPLVQASGCLHSRETGSSDCRSGTKAYNADFGTEVINIGKLTVVPAWILIIVLTALLSQYCG